jgi:FAD-dependent urate hydroxylase
MNKCDVAVIGAGPYGLSAAAHLIKGQLDLRVFGRCMSFWQNNMPSGMLLRSPWAGSHLSDPLRACTLDEFNRDKELDPKAPIPLEQFVEYGCWFQKRSVPTLDSRLVKEVSRRAQGFRLLLEDGDEWYASRVVLAAGIEKFAARPSQFEQLPPALASHTVQHKSLEQFRGKRVLVLGGGQSALESAALLREQGSKVEVVTRASGVRFLHQRQWMHNVEIVSRLLYAPPDVGPALVSQIVARPSCFGALPRPLQTHWHKKSMRPAGARWLQPRLREVPPICGRIVTKAVEANGCVSISFDNGSYKEFDHVLLATGYRVDISRYPFLSTETLSQIDRIDGYPKLNNGFESSIPGLYFIGATAAWSFGPLLRFVAGSEFAAKTMTKSILKSLSHSNGAGALSTA